MPPKPAPGKKGADEVDMSDLSSLPNLNFVTFTVLYAKFFSHATRDKIQKYVNDHFSQERVKVLTREEIISYGKGKQLILEPGQAQTLPHDDPRVKMTEAEQVAKAAYERLFEMQVLSRRTKKERLQKLEDEAKASGQPLQIDHDLLDVIFNLVDFPQSKEEAVAFAKLNTTLNFIFEVNQAFREVTPEDDDDTIEALQNQEMPLEQDTDGNDHANEEKTIHRIESLLLARGSTQKSSILRHLAHLKVDYVNWPSVEFKINEHGEEVEIKKDADQYFSDDLNGKLEHYGALYIKYLRFKEKVHLMPLAPDHHVLHTLLDLQGQSEDYKQWLSNVENLIASLDQQLQSDPGLSEQITHQKKEVEDERMTKAQEEEERKRIINDCRDKLRESIDDKYYIPSYDLDTYKKSFLPHKEGQNSISSIMSAMVTQIAQENSYIDVYNHHQQKAQADHEKSLASTAAEDSIDDLFDSFNTEVNYALQIENRPAYEDDHTHDNDLTIALGPSARDRQAGAKPYLVDQMDSGEVIEYNNEHDLIKRPIQKLNLASTAKSEWKAEDICSRSKKIIENLVLPGITCRHLMPPVSLKSERLRDLEKPNVYPFSTLPIEEVERGLIMKSFQELIRSNHIDEGALSDKQRHAKFKVFERNFEEHFTPDILRQVLAEALIKEPDIATLYYPRDDSLLVALYNKVKLERSRKDVDGERQWRAAYRVMPDFENWIKYFSEDMVVEAQGAQKIEGHPAKYQLDDELIPEALIDIDDQKVSNIQEHSQMFYPYDGSTMKVDICSVAGLDFRKSAITKDNLVFGLRRATDSAYQGQPLNPTSEETGLIAYKKVGDTDFWLRFDNDTKMLVESVQKKRNPQKLIRIDPPKPTPEEIAAREEAIKQAQAAAAKNKGKPGAPAAPVIEEYKEPEPTWEPEPFDFLDTLFLDDELEHLHFNQVTTTLANGLIVQHLTDGNIIQMTQDQLLTNEGEERDRLFLFASNGAVVRHFRNRDAEVLFPSGVRATFTKSDMTWVVTNNKGYRRAKKAGIEWDLEQVPCAYETDAVTNARMMVRDDKVMTIEFSDGSLFCQHADGTLMKTSPDGCEVRIEKEGYAPVVFKRGTEIDGAVVYPNRAEIEAKEMMTIEQRSQDKVIVETHLPDGTIVDTYLDCGIATEHGEEIGIVHLFNRSDFTVVAVSQVGDKVKIISGNSRSSINELASKRALGKDSEYLKAIHSDAHDITPNVFTAVVSNQQKASGVFISDKEIQYRLTADLQLVKQPFVEVDGEVDKVTAKHTQPVQIGASQNDMFENIGGSKDPTTKYFQLPRLFVIRNDGSGYELLCKEQLDYYFRTQKNSPESLKQRKDVTVGSGLNARAHYFLTKIRTQADREFANTYLKSLEFPSNSLYALIHLREESKKKSSDIDEENDVKQTQPDHYLFRQFFEFQPFEYIKQVAFTDDLERYKKWKAAQTRYETEFGITHAPAKDGTLDLKKIEDDEQVARKILTKIYKERKNGREKFNPDVQMKQFLRGINEDEQANEYQQRQTSGNIANILLGSDEGLSPKAMIHHASTGENSNRTQTHRRLATNLDHKATHKEQEMIELQQRQEAIRHLKDKQKENIEHQLQEIRKMINTPLFVSSYYNTVNGRVFSKMNPPKAPSQEVLLRMSQRIDRSQMQNAQQNTGQSIRSAQNGSPLGQTGGEGENIDDKESPIVALEPEEPGLKQGSAFLNGGTSKKLTKAEGTLAAGANQPSLYLQEKIYIKQKEQEHLLKAEEYHVVKTKEFNVVGRVRQDKPQVKVMQKSSAQSELNEKFITTECIADRRVKISSMAPRQYMIAPSVEDVRKQGQHQMILSAISKKQTFAELINQANAMVTGVLHDPLKRCFNVMPSSLKFGALRADQTYELTVTLKNEDAVAQRLNIKQSGDHRIKAEQAEMGLVAPGMIRKIIVTVYSKEPGQVKDIIQIVTKSDIYKIPIEATILNPDDYEREMQEQRALNKSLTNSRVRERLNQSIQKGRQSVQAIPEKKPRQPRPPREPGMDGAEEGGEEFDMEGEQMEMDMEDAAEDIDRRQQQQWVETTNSESKLPQLPQNDKRPFDVDPKKNLKEVLKK